MPAAWKLECLGELADISSGGTPRRDKAEYWGGDIPWVTTSQVDFCTINHADQHITQAGLKNSAARLLPAGTLLMALYGQGKTRGKVAKLGITAATNQACAAISIRPGTDENYVFHFLESQYEQIRNASNGGSQDNLSGLIVKKLPIALPSLDEQRAIASALSDMDALLAKLDQLITKKRDIKQAAMQELLTGKRRLPGCRNIWTKTTLSAIGKFSKGNGLSKESINNSSEILAIPYTSIYTDLQEICTATDIKNSTRPSPGLCIVDEACLLIASSSNMPANIGKATAYIGSDPVAIGGDIIIFKTNEDVKFLAYLLSTEKYRRRTISISQGSTIRHIYPRTFADYEITIPSIKEQLEISNTIIEIDHEIIFLEARREKTRLIKQGMMQALLTGRVRLV